MKLSDLGEFGLIAELEKIFAGSGDDAEVLRAIGDDCAVLQRRGEDELLLLTTDVLAEGVHFMAGADPLLLGRKALAVSLSDVAAMGGRPRFALVSLAAPVATPLEAVQSLFRGVAQMAEEYGVVVLGGDTTASESGLVVGLTVLGDASCDGVVYRSGARVGDLVFLSRPVGDSAAGLQIVNGSSLKRFFPPRVRDALLRRHLDPEPEVAVGQAIGASHLASAMIDVSDGLGRDLSHVCQQSGVRAEVIAESLPVSAELEAFAAASEQDPLELIAGSGEEYALLYTVAAADAGAVADAMALAAGRRPACIGRIVDGRGVVLVRDSGPGRRDLSAAGHEHFRSKA